MSLKNTVIFILSVCVFGGCSKTKEQNRQTEEISFSNVAYIECQPAISVNLDSAKSHQAKAVVKARLLEEQGGDKYVWTKVEIREVLCNKTKFTFPSTLRVAHYSWKGSVPENKLLILYLSTYPFGSVSLNDDNDWMLLNGDAENSVQEY